MKYIILAIIVAAFLPLSKSFAQNEKTDSKKPVKIKTSKKVGVSAPTDDSKGKLGSKPEKAKPSKLQKKKKKKKRLKKIFALLEIEIDGERVGVMKARLYHKKAPKTVDNFTGLAEGKIPYTRHTDGKKINGRFYDGLTFHRIIKNFVVQTGDPMGNGHGGPGYRIEDEFHPDLNHRFGTLSMANEGRSNSGGSQFFIALKRLKSLDKKHSIFGRIIGGDAILRKMSRVKTDRADRPKKKVILKSVKILREYF